VCGYSVGVGWASSTGDFRAPVTIQYSGKKKTSKNNKKTTVRVTQ
jgi:hypothetical protein